MEDFDDQEVFDGLMAAYARGDAVSEAFRVLEAGRFVGPGARGVIAQIAIDIDDQALLAAIAAVLRERTAADDPLDLDTYHLGNVQLQAANVDGCEDPDRYLMTCEDRREGRMAFATTGQLGGVERATQALTNLGNWLDSSGRWAEAFDAYRDALDRDPDNGMAEGNAAKLLLRRAAQTPMHRPHLHALATHYARQERQHREKTLLYGGERAAASFDRLPTEGGEVHPGPEVHDEYQEWIRAERLALGLTVEGLALGSQWDDVGIAQLYEPIDRGGHEVPALFAMINTIKQDYLFARRMTFSALGQVPGPDSATYADTLDYALYGALPAQLTLAQRAAVDLLDRIAVIANEYLEVGITPSKVTFRSLWTTHKHTLWRPKIRRELEAGNRSILALADLSFDLESGGYLSNYRSLRNAGTHRFVVLHDESFGGSAASRAVKHVTVRDFEQSLVSTLRIARAAILYLVELIRVREERHIPDGFSVPLEVPDHGRVRGYPSD